jgi:hypothetical protein
LYTNIILQRSSEKFENNCVLEILEWLSKEERLIEILNGLDVEIPSLGRWVVQH